MKTLQRIGLVLTLLLCAAAGARATDITVSSFTTSGVYQQADTVVQLRLFYSETFVDSLSNVIVGGPVGGASFFKSVTCTLNQSTKVVTCPSFTIPSTTDSSKTHVTLSGALFGGKTASALAQRTSPALFSNWKIPTSLGTTVTYAQLNTYNAARPLPSNPTYLNRDEVANLIAGTGQINAGVIVKGVTALSVAPVSATSPIAVGDNDPRVGAEKFIGSYASLAAAVSEIGSSSQTTLVMDSPVGAAGVTVPANIALRFTNSGQLTGSGTVTILGPIEAPPRQIFATTLTVSLTGNAFVNNLCVDWFETIATNVTDATAAIQKAVDTLDAANKSGNVLFQNKVYVVAGALQDTGASNSQIVLPKRPATNLALGFVGVPPDARSVIAVDTAGTVIKSTLSSGTGAMIGSSPRSFLSFYTDNITYRMPVNPTNSCLDMSNLVVFTFNDLKIDTGEVFDAVTRPTTATSYGLKMPQVNQAGMTEGRSLLVQGFYTNIKGGELTHITAITSANGEYALETPAAFHANYVGLFLDEHNVHGIRATGGESWWTFGLYDTEKAVAGWFTRVDDIVDASNFLHARLTWHEVTVNVGVTHTFTKVGGAYVYDQELHGTGTEIFSSFNGQNPKLIEINSNAAVSASTNVPWLSMVHNQSGTSEAVGVFTVSNKAIGASEKRLAQIGVQTNGATNTGGINFGINTAGTFAVEWIMTGAGLLAGTDGGGDIGASGANRPGNVYVAIGVFAPKFCYSATVCDFAGSGSPEGVVTADIGSTYRRTNGGAGTSFYVKESGAGNTGWVAK